MFQNINFYILYLMTSITDDLKITWNTEEKGTAKKGGMTFPIYTLQGKIKTEIFDYCNLLIQNPKNWQSLTLKELKPSYSRIDVVNKTDNTIDRKYYVSGRTILKELMDKHVIEFLHEKIKQESQDNFMFLAKLGKKRNWKEVCAICLADDIMGTTCGCGHTEIVIFKPCGHSICVYPCFEEWMESLDIELKPQTKIFEGNEYIIGNQKNVNLQFDDIKPKCPICKTIIKNTFRAEETYSTNIDINELSKLIYEEFIKKY